MTTATLPRCVDGEKRLPMSIYAQAAIVMVAAVVVVPLFKRIGLGAVLG